MKYVVTAGEMNNKGLWDQFCEVMGLSIWCMNEGRCSPDEEFTLTEKQAIKIGLVREGDDG